MCDHDWVLLTTKELEFKDFGPYFNWTVKGCKQCSELYKIGYSDKDWTRMTNTTGYSKSHYQRGLDLFAGGR